MAARGHGPAPGGEARARRCKAGRKGDGATRWTALGDAPLGCGRRPAGPPRGGVSRRWAGADAAAMGEAA
eukprot:4965265-Alexandrium_andersonii.AAC.1